MHNQQGLFGDDHICWRSSDDVSVFRPREKMMDCQECWSITKFARFGSRWWPKSFQVVQVIGGERSRLAICIKDISADERCFPGGLAK